LEKEQEKRAAWWILGMWKIEGSRREYRDEGALYVLGISVWYILY
jgi:hypothetical protein